LATTGKCMSEQVEFRVKLHDWHECATQASFIRKVVFVDEQGVSQEEEMDGRDDSCVHALATLGDTAVATGRLRPEGSIGRMAVLKPIAAMASAVLCWRRWLKQRVQRVTHRSHWQRRSMPCRFISSTGLSPKAGAS